VTWDNFLAQFNWKQGEHVTLVGTTGSGKTTLALAILHRRTYQLVVATKPQDELITELTQQGFKLIRDWPPPPPQELPEYRRVIYWPPIERVEDVITQRELIGDLLRELYATGGWTVYFDEVRYITQYLRHSADVELLWLQGRSLGLSIVAATQRPRNIPLAAYSQATHLFLWRDNDISNLRRLSELGAQDVATIQHTVANLEPHDALYVNTRTNQMLVTKVGS
jgi:energy-coupling factor transporter ATP-binding protein EcfA2